LLQGEGDLLSLIPDLAYEERLLPLGLTRRGILYVNDPQLVAQVLTDPTGIFPKNDLMVDAVAPLIGNAMFVSSGATWRRQRRMIEPAFSHMRLARAFGQMDAAVDEHEQWLERKRASGAAFSLDAAMGHLTADVITRTIFSTPLAEGAARDVFEAFTVFERQVASVNVKALLFDKPWRHTPQPARVLEACRRIRALIGAMIAPRFAPGALPADDICAAAIAAVDPETGAPFTREELIDELGVFFLAGHETSASALTWVFFLLAQRPEVVARIRAEVDAAVGDGPITIEHAKRFPYIKAVFKETMRLYPPITFLPRVAAEETTLGGRRVRRGTMVLVAPWTIHRHRALWTDPELFDPDRFLDGREETIVPGAYVPFGLGPRVCVGAAFATLEAALFIARLTRRFDFDAVEPATVRPVARLTTRPRREILMRVHARGTR
ncbi:MAG: cytochrome P450, partial [Gemmatimonadota bacterium]|nr:cytochrome P450 [Gemmatimonadota bacterium]